MSAKPWYRRYASDFIAGTMGLTSEQKGVYSTLLDLMYARHAKLEATSPKDVQALARTCGSTTRRFNQIVAELIEMPNKITRDAAGRLSNPKFEAILASENGPKSGPESSPNSQLELAVDNQLTNPQYDFASDYLEFSRRYSRDNLEIITRENETTSIQNNDLSQKYLASARARARSRARKKEEVCKLGGAVTTTSAPPHDDAAHMPESDFENFVKAVAKTIPRGWSPRRARQRFAKLPKIPIDDLVMAWRIYLDDIAEKSRTAKFPQRIHYPENWFRDRVYEPYLGLVDQHRETDRNTQAAIAQRAQQRETTITQWNGHAAELIATIGAKRFALFVPSTLTDLAGIWQIDFAQRDAARSEAEQFHGDALAKVFGHYELTSNAHRQRTTKHRGTA